MSSIEKLAVRCAQSEEEFAARVDGLASHPQASGGLTGLLREDNPVYDQRGAAATVRMRGWVLLALGRTGVNDVALPFLLEELDTGTDAYLVAAAAHALRSYPLPSSAFAPFVMRALTNIRYHDQRVSFEKYGEYAVGSAGTSPVRELLATLAWLGPRARGVLSELEALRTSGGTMGRKLLAEVDRTLGAIRADGAVDVEDCCRLPDGLGRTWRQAARRGGETLELVEFEDHDGRRVRFAEFFSGRPAIVVFFYTRCDNPLKCSLTVAKLGQVQKLLEERGMAGKIRTAAITYDPAFDLSERLRRYARDRGVRLGTDHCMLRVTDGSDTLRRHFELGVNFIQSLVNRHRVELYIVDAKGRVAASFTRLHWDEKEVVNCAAKVAAERVRSGAAVMGTAASLGLAVFPKCPVCWTAYLSTLGIAGAGSYLANLLPLLVILIVVNVGSVWRRRRGASAWIVTAGAVTILASRLIPGWESAGLIGVSATVAGSVWSVMSSTPERVPAVHQDRNPE